MLVNSLLLMLKTLSKRTTFMLQTFLQRCYYTYVTNSDRSVKHPFYKFVNGDTAYMMQNLLYGTTLMLQILSKV